MLSIETNSKVTVDNITSLWVLSSLSTLCSSPHSYAKGMFTGAPSPFTPLVYTRFFLREFFSRALLSERLEQARIRKKG